MLKFAKVSKASVFPIGLETRLDIIRVLAISGITPIFEILGRELPKLSVNCRILIFCIRLSVWFCIAFTSRDCRRRDGALGARRDHLNTCAWCKQDVIGS
jgi:hypothetical protein